MLSLGPSAHFCFRDPEITLVLETGAIDVVAHFCLDAVSPEQENLIFQTLLFPLFNCGYDDCLLVERNAGRCF